MQSRNRNLSPNRHCTGRSRNRVQPFIRIPLKKARAKPLRIEDLESESALDAALKQIVDKDLGDVSGPGACFITIQIEEN